MSTVTICCKLPNGLIIKHGEKSCRINGWNNNLIQGAEHGLTEDVPADLWEAWSKEHAESKLVKGGFVFTAKNERDAKSKSKERKDNKSGHEQLPKIKETDQPGALGASEER